MEEVVEKLKLGEVLEKLWMYILVDFITKLLIVAGKDAILVVCNRLLKMTLFCSDYGRDISERVSKTLQK